jgi:hypothetical protein
MIRSYINLIERVQRETIASSSPAFGQWFSKSKAVNSDGTPAIMFHGTSATFNSFKPMSHFGTEGAAQDRLKHLDAEGHVIGVHLSIQNPCRFVDNGWNHNIEAFLNDIGYCTQLFDEGISDEGVIFDKLRQLKVKRVRSWAPIIKFFMSEGFDGIHYVNRVEDSGSLSYAIFSPKQVWRISQDTPDR